jgi:N-acetylmuramoyl-L-alanine amidase
MKIAIDAGHGGQDSGALGSKGLKESATNLDIALRLGYLFETDNHQVLQSRTTDRFITLQGRCDVANSFKADYFISIHCNSNGHTAKGIETLVYAEGGTAYKLAKSVQAELVKATGDTNRGIKIRPDLAVLKGTKMPAILCEVGFISHPTYEDYLRQVNYKQAIAFPFTKL